MKAFFEARVEHLGPGDYVEVECVCGHKELLSKEHLLARRIPEYEFIQGLGRKMRCRECDERGKVMLSINWIDCAAG